MFKTISLVTVILGLTACASTFINASFKYLDKNNDQVLSYDEFYAELSTDEDYQNEAKQAGMSLEDYARQDFDAGDSNADGLMSIEEYDTWVRSE